MQKDRISLLFDDKSGPAGSSLRTDRVLNYVWLNKNRDLPSDNDDAPLCSVPLNYLDKAYENAKRYADTPVQLWVDFGVLDDSSRYFVETHHYLNAPSNASLKDLRDIPAYAAHPAYSEESKASIWNKVDLARFLVISHELDNPLREQVFYSDFDIDDADLDNPKTQERLNDTGMAFAELERGEMVTHGLFNIVQHAYVAMSRSRKDYLDEKMLPSMSSYAEKNFRVVSAIFRSVFNAVCDLSEESYYRNLPRIFTDVKVPPIGFDIPANTDYAAMKVCPPGFDRK